MANQPTCAEADFRRSQYLQRVREDGFAIVEDVLSAGEEHSVVGQGVRVFTARCYGL
jgi:hypothetical protein